ncbi:hypothetical protein INR49_031738 [Caranx melampygus]|nr:hypothetical protein INR49_031738 [Caranx melampygus]
MALSLGTQPKLQPDAVLILYNFSGQCSGEALITFPSEEMARRAVAERSNHPFYGQQRLSYVTGMVPVKK